MSAACNSEYQGIRIQTHPQSIVENTPWRNTHQVTDLSVMEIREIFAHNLRAARQARGLSQEELAHRADIDRTYISSLERRVYGASIDVVDRLASVLEMEASDLLKRPAEGKRLPSAEPPKPDK
ncbi:helix-turn-helix transcriptional regulator [Paracoccus sp. pheM1]|uniref:helix-turn-helix domain-containing protein n=2 Tax=Paracoccaceae TaxID=31989 RepID=UPI001F0AC55B|nr:helix-turn-helix transcriptional regulator [Paracoccus sp. pheM1]